MKLVSGIVNSGLFAQSALSAEIATKDSLGRNISETYLTGATLPVSGSAGDNSAVYDLYDMKIERNSPSIGGSEPEHTYVQVNTGSITLYESIDEDQSYNEVYINPGYIEFYNSVDGYVSFGGTEVLNWNSTHETVSNNSASWGGGAGGDMFVSGLAYTTGGEISSYSGSAFRSTDPTFELTEGYGISLTTGANSLTIANTLVLETGSI